MKFDTRLHDKYRFTPQQARMMKDMDGLFTADIKARAKLWPRGKKGPF